MKLCIITCYKQPDYIRARTLRAAAATIDGVEVVVVKNRRTGMLRYTEVFLKVLKTRITEHPDAYLPTFRGYEMLLPVRLLTIGRPLIYDEFINPIEWAVYEHNKLQADGVMSGLFKQLYRLLLLPVNLILTDTDSHAKLSAGMLRLPAKKFLTIPVGTDETTFAPTKRDEAQDTFTVLYYGNMLPLHGPKHVIEAATKLADKPVKFVLAGGSEKTEMNVATAMKNGANIDYKSWVQYDKLPALMSSADLCLAGPFGGTFQAQYVITGKAYQFLAMGRPIVVGENKESHVFSDRRDALVVKQASAEALAEAITWAMSHRKELSAIGKEGRALYERTFSNDHVSERLQAGLVGLGLLEPAAHADQ